MKMLEITHNGSKIMISHDSIMYYRTDFVKGRYKKPEHWLVTVKLKPVAVLYSSGEIVDNCEIMTFGYESYEDLEVSV